MRFVGVDFSTTSTGVAIFDENGLQTHTVKSVLGSRDLASYYSRVRTLASNVLAIIQPQPDDVVAIERAIVMGRRTDTEVRLHYAWHRFVECFLNWDADLSEPTLLSPSEVKQLALGGAKRQTGRDGKKQMVAAASTHFGVELRNDDEADAVWIATGASILAGMPVIDLPSEHLPEAFKLAVS